MDEAAMKREAARRAKAAGGTPDYFFPPHGGRPPSDKAVAIATERYIKESKPAKTPRKAKRITRG